MKTDWGEVLDGEIMRAPVNPADGMPTSARHSQLCQCTEQYINTVPNLKGDLRISKRVPKGDINLTKKGT